MSEKWTWIVVADGSRARILERLGNRTELHLVEGSVKRSPAPSDAALRQDRPGIVHESVGPTRHAIEPKVDYHQQAEVQFAKEMVEKLEKSFGDKKFERLVIVAPPVMLGTFRKLLSKRLRALVVAELDKDLTKIPDSEILKHIEA